MAIQHGAARPSARRVAFVPTTRLGWVALALAMAYFPLVSAWSLLPGGAALGFLAGIAGGVVALVSILRRGERAVTVFAAVVPIAFVGIFVLAELLVPH
jgi:hypothetical protein